MPALLWLLSTVPPSALFLTAGIWVVRKKYGGVRHAPGSPGDFRYTGYGDDYALEVHGWDLPTAGRKAEFGEVEEAPKPNTLEEDLDYVRSLDFPVFWLGLRSGEPAQNEVELPALTLTEAAACPPEPVCI